MHLINLAATHYEDSESNVTDFKYPAFISLIFESFADHRSI